VHHLDAVPAEGVTEDEVEGSRGDAVPPGPPPRRGAATRFPAPRGGAGSSAPAAASGPREPGRKIGAENLSNRVNPPAWPRVLNM
jgi:hypothetical protein